MNDDDPAFGPVRAVARLLSGLDRPWFVAGGWAIDLHVGERTRPHSDVEVAVFREDQRAVRSHLEGWTFEAIDDGEREPWDGESFLELPVHELHAHRPDDEDPPRGGMDELEVLLNESVDGTWVYRRDDRITRARSRLGLESPAGIPYLAPEVVLLYKTPVFGPHDHRDFEAALGTLGPERRAWLRRSIRTVDPGHEWLESL